MNDISFMKWLIKHKGIKEKVAKDYKSRLKRIQKALNNYLGHEVDLFDEYSRDRCATILTLINSKELSNMSGRISLPRESTGCHP